MMGYTSAGPFHSEPIALNHKVITTTLSVWLNQPQTTSLNPFNSS